jgi:hypothetical protein
MSNREGVRFMEERDYARGPCLRRIRHADRSESKAPWQTPAIEELPRLTELTLQTGDPVPGDEGVF